MYKVEPWNIDIEEMIYLKERFIANISMFHLYLALFMIIFYLCAVAKSLYFFSLSCAFRS